MTRSNLRVRSLIYDYLLTYDLMAECAIKTVKVLAFSSPLWKKGVRGDFITKTIHLISMGYWIVKSPSIPLFQRGRSKREYFHSLYRFSTLPC